VEERHIPRVRAGASQSVAVNVNRVNLIPYLQRMYRAGYWPDSFRATVMVEPRPGESLEGHIFEAPLPVQWNAGEGKQETSK
jgi:hypothetical protein